jgi:flagellar basal-body rod protein FlgC
MGDGMFSAIRTAASGLHSQRVKMDTVAQNLANAETTRTAEGTPYRRQRAVFAEALGDRIAQLKARAQRFTQDPDASALTLTQPNHLPGGLGSASEEPDPAGVDVQVGVAPEASEFRVIYDPGHPDADAEGYVLLPNVNPITEMVDMITASRAYEANVSAVQAAKDMFSRALEI